MASLNVSPVSASSPSPDEETSFSVYGESDPNFVNYAELYKSPPDLKQRSKNLVDIYADALITGRDTQLVYPDAPSLVGNRYFINTGTKCVGDDNTVHTRSVLVDNILTSTMNDAEGGNKGLMYSLLASMKTIKSDTLFADMTDGKPAKNPKYLPTGYLNNINMEDNLPNCKKITVYTRDKADAATTSGWVVDTDKIDPLAKKEGFTTMVEGLELSVPSGRNFSGFSKSLNSSLIEVQAVTDAGKSDVVETSTTASALAKQTMDEGKVAGEKAGKSATNMATTNVSNATADAKTNMDKAKASGRENALRMVTIGFLKDNPNITTIDILNQIIAIKYICGDMNYYRRVPGSAIQNIPRGLNAVIQSTDRDRSDLAPGQNIPREYSIVNMFDSIASIVDKKRYDFNKQIVLNDVLNSNVFPQQQIKIITKYKIYYDYLIIRVFKKWGYKEETIASDDYGRFMGILNSGGPEDVNTIKFAAARVLMQYRQPKAYGSTPIENAVGIYAPLEAEPEPEPAPEPKVEPTPEPVADTPDLKDKMRTEESNKRALEIMKSLTESFTSSNDVDQSDYETIPWFYMLSLLCIMIYIIYKFAYRVFDFERLFQ